MRSLLLLVCVIAGVSAQCTPSITKVVGSKAPAEVCGGTLVFDDEFDTLDFETWNHERTASGGGNWEFEIYNNNRSNSYVRDGILYIRPTLTANAYGSEAFLSSGQLNLNGGAPADECTNAQDYGCERGGTPQNLLNPVVSARIRSVYSFGFTYGKVEVRAKLPGGDWLWPAIWLLPTYNEYGSWPSSGEIDLAESRGNRNLVQNGQNIGSELSSSTLHFGPFWPLNAYEHAHFEKRTPPGQGFDQDFHLYQFEWTTDHIQFSIDNEVIGTVAPPAGGFWELGQFDQQIGNVDNPWRNNKMAPYDQPFYFVLDVAVGGINSYFPDNADNPGGKPWLNSSPQASTDFWNGRDQWLPTWQLDVNNGENAALQVDYIKVWAI